MCVSHIMKAEQDRGIPKGLLSSIAKIESGKKMTHTKGFAPWPWVINAGGEGRFFKTKGEAILAVQNLLKQGKKNIDIGCMQISYLHHGHKFESIAAMFDPQRNVEYGANFLTNLRNEQKSWLKAVGMYHSATLKFQVPYKKKVMDTWQKERLADYREIMLAARLDQEVPNKLPTAKLISGGWVYQGNSPLFFMVKHRVNQPTSPGDGQNGGGAKVIIPRHEKKQSGTKVVRGMPRFFKPVS